MRYHYSNPNAKIATATIHIRKLEYIGETASGNPSEKEYWGATILYQDKDGDQIGEESWTAYGKLGYKQRTEQTSYWNVDYKIQAKIGKGYEQKLEIGPLDLPATQLTTMLDKPSGTPFAPLCYELRAALLLSHQAMMGQESNMLDNRAGELIQAASQGDTVKAVCIIRDLEVQLNSMRTDVVDLETKIDVAKALIQGSF